MLVFVQLRAASGSLAELSHLGSLAAAAGGKADDVKLQAVYSMGQCGTYMVCVCFLVFFLLTLSLSIS